MFRFYIFFLLIIFNFPLYSHIQNSEETIKKELTNLKSIFKQKNTLIKYYKYNKYNLFWFDEKGMKDIATQLLNHIKNDPVLKPKAIKIFKIKKILTLLSNLNKNTDDKRIALAKIDFILTELYIQYFNYLTKGSIKWNLFQKKLKKLEEEKDIKANWDRYILKVNPINLLKESIKKNDINIILDKIDFTFPHAKKLMQTLKKLENLASKGGYIKLPEFKTLKQKDKSEIIKLLRKRLLQSQDLSIECRLNSLEDSCEEIFDKNLKEAVISFQKRHGLVADGVVGRTTRKYLNIPIEKKISKIRLNLERMRWLPRDLGNKYILINIPDYTLKMYEKDKIKLKMPVIVGKKKHPTPVFSDKVSYIVLNPYWKIPESITKKEIIPKLLENPNYLVLKGINIHENWDPQSFQYDSYQIDWYEYLYLEDNELSDVLPNFRFIQIPNDTNPLGKMKFMFPNKYSVYIHDTPVKSLFRKSKRAFSHGCIRLSKPKELLKELIRKDNNLNYKEALNILEDIEKKDFELNYKIPIHIIYITTWVDEKGKLQFRNDIYNYDKMQKNFY